MKEKFCLVYSSRGKVHKAGEASSGSQRRKLRGYVNHAQEVGIANWNCSEAINSEHPIAELSILQQDSPCKGCKQHHHPETKHSNM